MLRFTLLAGAATLLFAGEPSTKWREWSVVAGGPDGLRYSQLAQINRDNVGRLQVAWTYDTEDAGRGTEMQCNPIIVNGVLYATSPRLKVVALDAATGTLKWKFDPYAGAKPAGKQRNRGLTYWASGNDKRIFVGAGPYLYSLDAVTGELKQNFGNSGRIDLREGLGRDPRALSVGLTSPGVAYKDLLIVGSIVPETLPSAPGDIRAFDARTGRLRWQFHTIPHPGEFGYESWPKDAWTHTGGANNWTGMALDERRGIVFVPTGSASFDFYGSDRHGDNLFANSLIALDAATGKRIWHFQTVRHDLWDRDLPAPPSLVTVTRNGRAIDAVAQITKSGYVYLFERRTGKPLFPIADGEYPQSVADGEATAPRQPLPTKPPPFARQKLTEDLLTSRTPEAHQAVLHRFKKIHSDGQFVPPTTEGTVVFPGFDGGGEWGGAAFDPGSQMLYVNANEMAWILRLVEQKKPSAIESGRGIYVNKCSSCHRVDLLGTPGEFPSLAGIQNRRSEEQVRTIVRKGAGRMPAFQDLPPAAFDALIAFVYNGVDTKSAAVELPRSATDLKYRIDGYNKFLDPDGYPAVKPPWGTLTAIDLKQGGIAWQIPFGEYPELAAKGMTNTGSENYGGPVVTAGGLLFIGATVHDNKFRAFDKTTGKLLWETVLPAAGNATPAVYQIEGRQFIAIACGGGKSGAPSGGKIVAFALPDKSVR